MNFLREIVGHKNREIAASKRRLSFDELKRKVLAIKRPMRSFLAKSKQKGLKLIAEVKKGSPSRGVIRKDFQPVRIALMYLEGGADAISVLTDRKFFFGSPEHLKAISRISTVPVLRKDFIVDPYQLWEAKLWGADMVLLIVACLPDRRLKSMLKIAESLGLEVLTEVHDKIELRRALSAGCRLIGVNNRDLKSFKTDIGVSLKLKKLIPSWIMCVSESGIFGPQEVGPLRKAGYDAVLVGEALMRENNPARIIKEMKGHA